MWLCLFSKQIDANTAVRGCFIVRVVIFGLVQRRSAGRLSRAYRYGTVLYGTAGHERGTRG